MDTLQNGSLIVLSQFGRVAIVRRLWTWDHYGVYVHDEKQYLLRVKGQECHEPVGFRWDDAFVLPDGINPSELEGQSVDNLNLEPLANVFSVKLPRSA
jgi:hypothetical protein